MTSGLELPRSKMKKRKTSELGYGEPIPEINAFIANELERHGDGFSGQGRPDLLTKTQLRDELNDLFRASARHADSCGT